mmetsp:Transcript_26410/g.53042  ORF Transcript_26410/g.53042 Transcript_26410/m.53042 type:complete len:207 (+) Transcript_26410:1092-1712(+)
MTTFANCFFTELPVPMAMAATTTPVAKTTRPKPPKMAGGNAGSSFRASPAATAFSKREILLVPMPENPPPSLREAEPVRRRSRYETETRSTRSKTPRRTSPPSYSPCPISNTIAPKISRPIPPRLIEATSRPLRMRETLSLSLPLPMPMRQVGTLGTRRRRRVDCESWQCTKSLRCGSWRAPSRGSLLFICFPMGVKTVRRSTTRW